MIINDEIETLKETFEGIVDLNNRKKLKEQSSDKDLIVRAEILIEVHSFFNNNLYLLEEDLKKKLEEIIKIDILELINLFDNWEYRNYYDEEKVRNFVRNDYNKIKQIIDLFFRVTEQ